MSRKTDKPAAPLLTRAAILAATDLPREVVPVPEWGGPVLVQGLTAQERSEFETGLTQYVRDRNGAMTVQTNQAAIREMRERMVALSVVNEDGSRMFSTADIKELGKKSAAALERIVNVAQRLNGMSKADLEELAGNSAETDAAASSSG